MKNLNNELVNTLAMEIINTNDAEVKDLYYTSLFTELEDWVKARAYKSFDKLRGYGATYEDVVGHYHDSIQKVLEGKAFTTYDVSKGNFVAVVYNEARNPLKDYADYLQGEKRSVTKVGKSLNEQVNDDASNTLGDLIKDEKTNVADNVSDSMYVSNLLDEFSSIAKDGQAKSKAIYLSMYPEMYDNQDVAEALGFDSYSDNARQKFRRVKKEFQKFMSQTA